nr:HU family DNA-binding protein [Treponema sp.]
MNKTELVDAIAADTGLSKKDTEAAVKSFIETVTKQLTKGESVQLIGFGTF